MLRQRPAALIATFLSLAIAVAIVTACGAMLESGLRFHGTTARYAAVPVLVATGEVSSTEGSGDDADVETYPLAERGRLPASLQERIAALPGVRAAISDTAVPGQVVAHGQVAGIEVHPWSAARLAPFTMRSGAVPGRRTGVVLDQPLAARLGVGRGQHVQLVLATGTRTVRVAGIAATNGVAPEGDTVFADDATAAALAHGVTSVIAVFADAGVSTAALSSSVHALLPPVPDRPSGAYARVYTGADRGSVESLEVDSARELVIAVSSVFGGCALLIAVLVIAGTVGLSVKQRHRDIALLRAIAATPRQVRRMVIRETTAHRTPCRRRRCLAGVRRSAMVARPVRVAWHGAGLLLRAPVVAAADGRRSCRAADRRRRGVDRHAAHQPGAPHAGPDGNRCRAQRDRRGPFVLGIVALAGGIAICSVAASATGDGAAGISVATVFTLVVAVALLSPLLIRVAAQTAGRALRVFGTTGRLAAANTNTSARRLSAVVSSLVLAVALGGSLWFVQTSQSHVAAHQTSQGLVADYVVSPAAPGAPPDLAERLRHTAGIVAATGVVQSTLFSPDSGITDYSVRGIDVADSAKTVDLGVTSGRLDGLHGATVAVDELAADELNLHVGSHFHGWFGDGAPADLRVVAIYDRGLGFGKFTVDRDLLLAHTASGLDDSILLATSSRPAVVNRLRALVARLAPGASLLPRSAYRSTIDRNLTENAWTNQVVTGVLLIYVVIAAVNTLLMYALGRRREFAVLRLAGTTRVQVIRMVRLEQVLLLGLSLVIGAAIAAATLLPMVKGTTGSATPYIPLAGWIAVLGGVVVLGGASTVVPVRRALRLRPVEAIGLRE